VPRRVPSCDGTVPRVRQVLVPATQRDRKQWQQYRADRDSSPHVRRTQHEDVGRREGAVHPQDVPRTAWAPREGGQRVLRDRNGKRAMPWETELLECLAARARR